MKSTFGHAADWPFGFGDLARDYADVERVMEIAGGGDEHILPRSSPYPFPAHVPARSDVNFRDGDPLWVPSACARGNGGSRPDCCANGICDRCPIDSKFTILNSLEKFLRPGVFLLAQTEAREVRHANGLARAWSCETGHRIM